MLSSDGENKETPPPETGSRHCGHQGAKPDLVLQQLHADNQLFPVSAAVTRPSQLLVRSRFSVSSGKNRRESPPGSGR